MANVIMPLEHLQAMRSAKVQPVLCKLFFRLPLYPPNLLLSRTSTSICFHVFVSRWDVVREEDRMGLGVRLEGVCRKANDFTLLWDG